MVGLNKNLPHTFGQEAVRNFLLIYEEDIHLRFHITFVLEPVDSIVKNYT